MYLINTCQQNRGKRFLASWLLIGLLLNGCQSLPSYFIKTSYDAVSIHEFVLGKNQDLVGTIASIQTVENDTLSDIARHFGLGFNDISIANPDLDPWLPQPGRQVILPIRYIIPAVKRQGMVLNLASMRLFNFPKQQPRRVMTYPIGIGRKGWRTPTGLTKIISKKKKPVWQVPISIRREHAKKGDPLPGIVPAGPDNPLGDYAMRLSMSSYLIHGTNKPYGVGMQISHGCIRLYPEDIETLFNQTSIGTKVRIVDQPYLLGWDKDMLFLEAHEPLKLPKILKNQLHKKLKRIAREKDILINWSRVEKILKQADGIPRPILQNHSDYKTIADSTIHLTHPQYFYYQPIVDPITWQDWSITVTTFDDANTAQRLVALLNHQGPPIPARKIQKKNSYHVVAGPFDSKKEVQSYIAKIRQEFQFNGIAHPPQSRGNLQFSQRALSWLLGK